MLNKTKIESLVKTTTLACLCGLMVTLSGCGTTRKAEPLFWPSPPDAPRIQYLKAVKDSTDVEDQKSLSLLDLGKKERGVIPIIKPYGIEVKKGKIYVCDTIQAEVIILDLPGKKAATLAGNKGGGKLKKPINVAVDDDGFIYVTDTARREVLKYGPDGEFLRAIGSGLDMKPTGLAVDELYIYVLDVAKQRILLLDRITNELVRVIGPDADPNYRPFSPLGIGLDGKGGIYITNLDGRIIHYDRDGHPIRKFGKLGTAISEFSRPRSIIFDKEGIMYVVDAGGQHVRLLNDKFQLLMIFGDPGTRGSLNVPAGIAVSNDNLDYYQQFAEPDFVLDKVVFVVSQFGDHLVSIYGIGKKKGVDYDALLIQRQEEIKKKEEEIRKKREEKEQKEKEEKEKGGATGVTSEPAAAAAAAAPAAPAAPAGKQ